MGGGRARAWGRGVVLAVPVVAAPAPLAGRAAVARALPEPGAARADPGGRGRAQVVQREAAAAALALGVDVQQGAGVQPPRPGGGVPGVDVRAERHAAVAVERGQPAVVEPVGLPVGHVLGVAPHVRPAGGAPQVPPAPPALRRPGHLHAPRGGHRAPEVHRWGCGLVANKNLIVPYFGPRHSVQPNTMDTIFRVKLLPIHTKHSVNVHIISIARPVN
mmetsp:Transcript_25067/g.40691  ORF Transcript_25067/g.40691 Transcript_25067/m.40691 type:complete len:218 (-) Transcript_25067:640-1293(-)